MINSGLNKHAQHVTLVSYISFVVTCSLPVSVCLFVCLFILRAAGNRYNTHKTYIKIVKSHVLCQRLVLCKTGRRRHRYCIPPCNWSPTGKIRSFLALQDKLLFWCSRDPLEATGSDHLF